ncbi:MAG TPA: diguanylate cyclase [Candidatus Wunengus sp. YC63]|uniref:diguanylate cyclase n=1 Tax=Candidatus Wunengus sp. YC63 TaxID=3367699 RepID=UPI004028895A
MIKIAVIGAGNGGRALLDIFHTNGNVKIIGITDKDKNAPGLNLAKEWGIFVAEDIKEFYSYKPDIIINATGKPGVSEFIKESFPYPIEVIDGLGAKLLWELVSRHQKAKKDMEDSLTYLQGMLNDSQDMIITTDREGRLVKYSKGGERILGYRADEIIGCKVSEFYVNKDERSNILKTLHEKGAVYNYETKLLKKDGSPVDISLTISVLRDRTGSIIGTVGISKDVTEEKRLREELKKKNEELEELTENLEDKVFERTKELEKINRELSKANEMKGRFIANASHELRTPLHSIIGFSEILLQKTFGDLNEKQQRYTNTIYTSGKHLIHLVNNILDLAKIEAGKMELSHQTFPLKTTIDEVLMVLKPLAGKKVIEPKIEMSSEVDSFTADKIKFKQILYNLLSNAIKFTPEGGTVGVNIEKVKGNKEILPWALESQRLLKVSVWDTGVGIRPEDREKIFEEFEQLDPSKSTEGTGLGLSLTKKLVELHGGQIEVGGTYGQGAIFNVYLPFVVHEKQTSMPKPILPPIAETRLKEECPLVLVVEDDIPTVEILTIHLTQAGYRIAHAYDGEEAILKAKELKPFVITLDIMLPKKDGWEVLQSLKANPDTRDIPVIIHSIIENKELAFALGATDYMVKPVDKSILLEKLTELSLLTKKARYPINILVVTNDNTIRNNLYNILQNEGFVMQSASDTEGAFNLALTTKPNLMIVDLNIPEGGFKIINEYRENPALRDIPIFAITSTNLSPDERLEVVGQIEMVLCKDAIISKEIVNHLRNIEVLYPKKAGLIDELTGVFNYRYFQIRLAQEIRRSTRYNLPLVLLILDVDQFGHYVNKKGEHYGNLILKKIAEVIRKNIRGSDVLVRHGIDSFAIVLTNTFLSSGLILAKRFVSMIHDYPFLYEDVQPKGKITISMGASEFKEHSPEELIHSVELALSSAITKGRNRVEVFPE